MKISVSSLKLFKACRRAWQLRYIEGLTPIQKAEALETGSTYHSKIEDIYNNGYCDTSDNSKESAMALAYEKYIYPNFKVKAAEEWFEYEIGKNGNVLIGRVDGVTEDGHLVEHKTTSMDITEKYEYDLQWDEQILAYMLGYGVRKMWYTVIKKPTIRQKKDETEEEFFDRMCKWYDEDTDSKIKLLEIIRTDEEIEAFEKELEIVMGIMENAEVEDKFLYKNPLYCNCWGRRCEYSSVCLHYDPEQEYIDFERRTKDGNQEN